MSGLYTTRQTPAAREPLGTQLRRLREGRALPIRVPAAAAEMDPTLLSKIENGKRLPTEAQTAALAKFFGVPAEPMHGARIAESFLREHSGHPAFAQASALIQEAAGEYRVKKMSAAVNKSGKPVNKRRKSK